MTGYFWNCCCHYLW